MRTSSIEEFTHHGCSVIMAYLNAIQRSRPTPAFTLPTNHRSACMEFAFGFVRRNSAKGISWTHPQSEQRRSVHSEFLSASTGYLRVLRTTRVRRPRSNPDTDAGALVHRSRPEISKLHQWIAIRPLDPRNVDNSQQQKAAMATSNGLAKRTSTGWELLLLTLAL